MNKSSFLLAGICALALVGSANAQEKPTVQFIATGGTIAMKIDPVKKAPVPAISGDDLLATVPEVAEFANIEVDNLSNVPSDYMDPPRWIELSKAVNTALERPEVSGVIVSHGTDTLEETAFWLDLTVESDKPVVVIGAQRNASSSDFDGPRNLLNAVRIAVDDQAKGKGRERAVAPTAHRDQDRRHAQGRYRRYVWRRRWQPASQRGRPGCEGDRGPGAGHG